MTKWDYLRQFHANHPEAGKREPEWLKAFDRQYKESMARLKTGNATLENLIPVVTQTAARQAERLTHRDGGTQRKGDL